MAGIANVVEASPQSSLEKIDASHLEKTGGVLGLQAVASDEQLHVEYDEKETKKILRKIDYRLLPVLTLLYLLAFLDRGNIGNARVAGMNADLKLTGYLLILSDNILARRLTYTENNSIWP
ncbi:hypothetical protein LTR05_001503 [Lithohypha guttulata]|uniref:Uncharacterized protein n=1 Tax=Lithohypha guttulata TaxID=1690604 RepID=A0AAN7YAK6_9EURO|nr:hypothetical protein LTR05_001503 [Lithohypha guttulata]